jgi:hypothetical protein
MYDLNTILGIDLHIIINMKIKQEMCASQNMAVYINYQTVKNSIYSK